eukprot:jgi/Galph1/561/GphlegSOOS_G5331.1
MTNDFSWEHLLEKFENVSFPKRHGTEDELPEVPSFVEACIEMGRFFNILGRAFSFVQKDILSKSTIVREYYQKEKPSNGNCSSHLNSIGSSMNVLDSLQEIIEREIATGSCVNEQHASCSRTVLRLLWATHFLYVLVQKLTQDEQTPLRYCVREAYDSALKEHHSWAVEKAVYAALVFLPSREFFYKKIGIDTEKREMYMQRGDKALG